MNTHINKTVVVGIDGTRDGERALWYGVDLATREGLDLQLIHVPQEFALYAPVMPYLPSTTFREIGESVLREATKHAEEAGFDAARTTAVLAEGPRTAALLRHLDDARHIVLGTRTSAIQHLLTGATTLSVVAHSPVPVHCVPRSWSGDRTPSGRIVVGVDGSETDADVLREAFVEASALGASLEIVHAWRPASPYDASVTGRVIRDDWDKVARAALTRRIELVAADHSGVDWKLRLDFERVSVALHEAAINAQLLVLGRHSHNPLLGLLVGSNTRTSCTPQPVPSWSFRCPHRTHPDGDGAPLHRSVPSVDPTKPTCEEPAMTSLIEPTHRSEALLLDDGQPGASTARPPLADHRTHIADPGPLGLAAFAGTTFVLSLFNAGLVDVKLEAVVLPLALVYGGLVQLLAGMWEFRKNNTFGAVAFSSYGAFWISFFVYVRHFAPTLPPAEAHTATGIFLLVWTIFTAYMTLASVKTNAALTATFAAVLLTFALLTVGEFAESASILHAGGFIGLVAAACAWYASAAGVVNPTWGRTLIPVLPSGKR